jgi:membrane protein
MQSGGFLPESMADAIINLTLGNRLAVGQRTLDPHGKVRILLPQPTKQALPGLIIVHSVGDDPTGKMKVGGSTALPAAKPKRFRDRLTLLGRRFLEKRWGQLAARTAHQLGQDGASDMAAGIAYYALLSVFPLLIGLIGLLGFLFPSELVQRQLLAFLETNMPAAVGLLQDNISSIVGMRGTLSILSLIGLLWSGGALFASIGRVTDRAWGIQKYRPYYVRKLRDLSLVLLTGIIFFISLGLTAISALVPPADLPFAVTAATFITRLLAFLLIFFVFLLICRYLPNTRVAWRDIWRGALIGAILFEAIRSLFTWYLTRFADFQVVYGSIASVIAFLLWIYLSAFVLIIGIELGSEYTKYRRQEEKAARRVE